MPFLLPNQQRQSTEGKKKSEKNPQIMGNATECFYASVAQMIKEISLNSLCM